MSSRFPRSSLGIYAAASAMFFLLLSFFRGPAWAQREVPGVTNDMIVDNAEIGPRADGHLQP